MAQLLVRDLDETVRQRLRERAARHGRSMESEARLILTTAVTAGADDPIDRILASMQGRGAQPAAAPDQAIHDHATFE